VIEPRPWLAASLRGHALWLLAAALLAVLGLALGSYRPPPLITADAVGPSLEPQLRSALAVLAASQTSAELRAVLDENHVQYQFATMAPRTYARYSVARKTIDIDGRWRDDEPVTLAAVIAHEAVHVEDAVSGYLSSGGANACVDSELRAFRASARFWTETYGPLGKLGAADDLEQQLNLIAVREQHDPAGFERLVRQTYVNQCGG
jgi:hypothetical protein